MRESRERKEEEYNIYTLITRTPLANTSAVTEQQSPMQALRNITPLAVWALVRRHRLPRPEKTLEYCSKHVAQMKCYSCLCSLFLYFTNRVGMEKFLRSVLCSCLMNSTNAKPTPSLF